MDLAVFATIATICYCGSAPALAQSCDLQFPPVGLIDVEYSRLDRELGPLKCPLALEEPILDRPGAFQEFERGQIVWSPQSGRQEAIFAAYYKPECADDVPAEPKNGPGVAEPTQCIVFRWKNLPESNVFVIRLADQEDAGIVPEERQEGQLDVVVEDSAIDVEDPEDNGFDPNGRVFASADEPLTGSSGAIAVRVNRYNAGRYKFSLKACTRDSAFLGLGESTECPHDWSNPAFVDYEFVDLRFSLNRSQLPTAPSAEYLRAERRNAALHFACRRADWVQDEESGGAFGMALLALLGSEPIPLFTPPGSPQVFTCPRELDNLTTFDTVGNALALNLGDDILPIAGGNCDAGLGPVTGDTDALALQNECLAALALRKLQKKKVVGTDTSFNDEGILATLGWLFGGPLGWLAGEELDDCSDVKGDYDFELQWLIRIMLLHGPVLNGDGKIDETTWRHLLALLSETGRGTFDRAVLFCGFPVAPETENHMWMIESARYITNAILTADALRRGQATDPDYDNVTNGQRDLILGQLRKVLIEDFYEFNSRPYQRLTVYAIRNLYEMGGQERGMDPVGRAAEVVLDYLSARYSLSANGLRRVANFRRQPHRARFGSFFQTLGDEEMSRLALYTGGSLPLADQRFGRMHPWEVETMVFHATGRRYDVPELVSDYLLRGVSPYAAQDVLQRFRSRGAVADSGLEIHFSTPRFMLSAGGVTAGSRLDIVEDAFGDEDSSPLPTTLLLSNAGRGWQELIRFAGVPDSEDRINTCVGPNFACGVDPVMPSTIPSGCIQGQGHWTFINFNRSSSDCNRPFGVHVALWRNDCTEQNCAFGGSTWGVLEVQESPIPPVPPGPFRLAQEIVAFLQFQTQVQNNNAPYESSWDQANSGNLYKTTKGALIQFNAGPVSNQEWSVIRVNGGQTPPAKDWPVAQGTIMNALLNEACIEYENGFRGTRLVLDLRDLGKDPRQWKCEVPIARVRSCSDPNPCP